MGRCINLFPQHTISLSSSLCRAVWKHWTCDMLVRYILSSVRLRLSLFSRLFCMQHLEGLVQEKRNSIDNALELRISWTNPSIWGWVLSAYPFLFWLLREYLYFISLWSFCGCVCLGGVLLWGDELIGHMSCREKLVGPEPSTSPTILLTGREYHSNLTQFHLPTTHFSTSIFNILHRARQGYYHTLYKISKRSDNWKGCYHCCGQTKFREIWV